MQTHDTYIHVPTPMLQELFNFHTEKILERLVYYKPSDNVLNRILAPLLEMNNELLQRGQH